MPVYCYEDLKSGEQFELVMPIATMSRRQRKDGSIRHKGRTLQRNLQAEGGGNCPPDGNYPLMSDAMGVHPSQCDEVEAYAKRVGVPTRWDRKTGQAVLTSRKHRKLIGEARGFHDNHGGYGDPQPGGKVRD